MKDWLINVGLSKFGPSVIRAALAGLTGLLLAHAGVLAKLGVVYDGTAHTVTLHLSALQEWLDVSGLGLIAGILTIGQHHVVAAINGTPQTGGNS